MTFRLHALQIAPSLLRLRPKNPGYFDVLTSATNIMQDQITRARLAGESPQVVLLPALGDLGPMEFHRAGEAMAEGRASVEQALPIIERYLAR